VILDGGDSLFSVPRSAPPGPHEQHRALAMLRGLGGLGTDGLAIGEAELGMEMKLLVDQARQTGLPLLCANLEDKRGRAIFTPRRMLERGGVKVGLFALFDDGPAGKKVAEERELRLRDAVESARAQVALLHKEGAELIVMLAHVGMPRAKEVATKVPGIHLGLVGHTGWRTNEPEAVGGKTFLVEAGRRGQALAHLEVRLGEGWQPEASLVDDSRRHVLYLEASRDAQAARKAAGANPTAMVWRSRVEPQAERARTLAKQLAQVKAPAAKHTLISRLVELDENVPEQAGMKALLAGALAGGPPVRAEASPRAVRSGKIHRIPAR
jgi:2',3'-cyclic-nucleotide 2'-phosphodiesterase (5'-nucleotidase family)